MTPETFLELLQEEAQAFTSEIATKDGDWIVKGLIDIYHRVYPMTTDTKMVAKVFEMMLLPLLYQFATKHGLRLETPSQQNFYPDITFLAPNNNLKFAVDIKTTYRISDTQINGMTLGAFTGYFRNRESAKNTKYPYGEYAGHYVLGVVYSRHEHEFTAPIPLSELDTLASVIYDFAFFVQPKYRVASALPGSGNTKNIGSINNLSDLIHGRGSVAQRGESVYDDYWMNYLTQDMAEKIDSYRPYINLKGYIEYKRKGAEVLEVVDSVIENALLPPQEVE